ncbi:hypothetical protein [Rhizobium sp. C104]|uniref:hypothetical protein n=1 Tax=Rhizobium sp. C104 TaxID=2917727 RepID=UPI001EF8369E|nr:hypothetical protein [Rhizobium sp. C104]
MSKRILSSMSSLPATAQPGKTALAIAAVRDRLMLLQENCGGCATRPKGRSVTAMAQILFEKSISIFRNSALAAVDCRQHLNLPALASQAVA